MSEIVNCNSCGASNNLPEGKNSMFCAFCGNSIVVPIKIKNTNEENNIKVKPQISQRKTEKTEVPYYSKSGNLKYKKEETVVDYGGALSLINRELKSLDEITSWFSDNELSDIKGLFLNDNKIDNLNGIERFTRLQMLNLSNNKISNLNDLASINNELSVEIGISFKNNRLRDTKFLSKLRTKKIDLSENKIVILDDFPQLSYIQTSTDKIYDIEINLSNNFELTHFSDLAIKNILKLKTENGHKRIDIKLFGCNKFDFKTLESVLKEANFSIWIYLEPNSNNSEKLKNIGFAKVEKYCDNSKWTWRYPKLDESSDRKNISIGLSFWNWIHISAPYTIALFCYYSWEETFLGWLFLGYFLTEMITMAPYMDREAKTGRSFKTKYGRIEEYQTIKGESGNDMENMTGKIHIIHFLGMILIIIYAIYSLFSSINADKSNTKDVEILNSNNREINNQINESEIELIPEANDTLSKDKLSDDTYSAENISDSATTVSEANEVLLKIDKSANKIYNKYDVDVIPVPIGGVENLMKIIRDKFPQKPRMYKNFPNYISFVVEKDGSLSDIHITSTGELDVSEEILKYLKTSTKWNSGEINGEKVRVEYGLETN